MEEVDFIPARSKKIERILRETMSDRGDETVRDEAADAGELSVRELSTYTRAKLRDTQGGHSLDREFNRYQAEQAKLNKPRPPVVGAGFKLIDWMCQCCAKSFRTLRAKEFCSDECTEKGPPLRELTCEYCGESFQSKRFDARYCPGGACQKAAKRKQIAELSRTALCEDA